MTRSLFKFLAVFTPILALIAWFATSLMETIQYSWLERDLSRRSALIFASIEDSLVESLTTGQTTNTKRLLNRISQDELIHGILVVPTRTSETQPPPIPIASENLNPILRPEKLLDYNNFALIPIGNTTVYMWKYHFPESTSVQATVYIFSDATRLVFRHKKSRTYAFIFFVVLGIVVVTVSTLVARWTISRPLQDLGVILRDVVSHGSPRERLQRLKNTEFAPLIHDLLDMTQEVQRLKVAATEGGIWTPQRLRSYVQRAFEDFPLCVIANREPYIHNLNQQGQIDVIQPASGLVSGVEPILKACQGVWIAHGSGSADQTTVDANQCIRVPPQAPEYTLRRVWLTPEEEAGYYYGFSNEGLWPLCHIAHQRPQFKAQDWDQYLKVNQKFADAFSEQFKGKPAVILIQDYHFALLPKMIRNISPKSIILLFWHIPWPNPEAFGICPWKQEIVESMLGADVLGFHTQFHCNNFLDTVDRYVESRIDRERFSIQFGGHECRVRPFPISIHWDDQRKPSAVVDIREIHHLPQQTLLAIGVDRVDYTKGLLERMRGIERFAQLRPDLAQKLAFIQIGSPSRTRIPAYQRLNDDVLEIIKEINAEFRSVLGRDLIILKLEHHNPDALLPYYEQSNICLVSPLHDGMNLVAKEFVAARLNEDGVLILSQFAGASRELRESLIVNPYGPDDIASKLIQACEMSRQDQRDRMRRMRKTVQENNVYRWAYLQLQELHDVRLASSLRDDNAQQNT